jgi:hypothetical protein
MKKQYFFDWDIEFESRKDKVQLSGTLSLPNTDGYCPCVILISGSGPQTRDQIVSGHKLFKDIAHYLSSNGIAVLRFDDRGVGKSLGDFDNASLSDFVNDILSAFEYAEEFHKIDSQRIGVLGHSIGGLLGAMVATKLKDRLSFLISLAAPATNGYDLYTQQYYHIAKAQGAEETAINQMSKLNENICNIVIATKDKNELRKRIRSLLTGDNTATHPAVKWYRGLKLTANYLLNKSTYHIYLQKWFKDWLITNPEDYWLNVYCPVLAINGGKDLQVDSSNLTLIERYLEKGGNNSYETKLFPNMNHLFQVADSGLPEEYSTIKSSISTEVLDYINEWIETHSHHSEEVKPTPVPL